MEDIIFLTKEQLTEIYEIKGCNFLSKEIITCCVLPKFTFFYEYDGTVVRTDYELEDRIVKVTAYLTSGRTVYYEVALTEPTVPEAGPGCGLHDLSRDDAYWLLKKNGEQANWYMTFLPFYQINDFLLEYEQKDVMQKEKHQVMTTKKNRENKEYRVARTYKCYTLKEDWKKAKKRKIEITCPSWTVRGHYRHYANGKVIFIHSYTKGKDRDKLSGKEYRILPKQDA